PSYTTAYQRLPFFWMLPRISVPFRRTRRDATQPRGQTSGRPTEVVRCTGHDTESNLDGRECPRRGNARRGAIEGVSTTRRRPASLLAGPPFVEGSHAAQ